MILINTCKEVIGSKKYNGFKCDIIFMDCFHNVNAIRFEDGKKYKKNIIKEFNTGKYISINYFNEYLKEYNLCCFYLYDIRGTFYYYDICDIDKIYGSKKAKKEERFSDLD